MARYCANDDCVHSTHPLSEIGGTCPECGSSQFRLKPDAATITCASCDSPNEAQSEACWVCGASLSQHRVIR